MNKIHGLKLEPELLLWGCACVREMRHIQMHCVQMARGPKSEKAIFLFCANIYCLPKRLGTKKLVQFHFNH